MDHGSGVVVIVPVYNRSRTVIETLRSVARQTRYPDLLLIVDDGSTDDIAGAVASWQESEKPAFPVQLTRKDNGGAAMARNFGLSLTSDSPYVAFLDSDDCWPADFLERTTQALAVHPDAVAVSCDQVMVDFANDDRQHVGLEMLPHSPIMWMFENGAGIGSCTLLRAAAVRELGGYPEHIPTGHDVDLFFRIARCGAWLFAPGAPVEMGRNRARIVGEHDHLCRSQTNFQAQWAAVFEDVSRREGLADLLPKRFLARQLAHRWYRAARQWERLQDSAAAITCYRRSLAHQRALATWLRLQRALGAARKHASVTAPIQPVRKPNV